ncbi:peptide chain release factor N(5)-glutamine methyltransferase [Holzapfeliella floricola]|uniref:Release factor glutamine methyltransferase n=1 Tax=Holzapfeliella floricola DSM 23037 = JCM 16512 TaxID=1423744 RepID=A0A0R2DU37_9LACO|nr:peptide chain release factor N(5)-glutamine methyltransferase [Holzapfeliella floricola]KRN03556.1 methylase of polypeptide chain release factor [Holzapfeliella floricola DSM 23037 = JCM 16512]
MTNPTIKEAIDSITPQVIESGSYPEDIAFLLGERLNYSPTQLKLNQESELSESQYRQFKADVKKLIQGQSPQYILEYSYFYGRKLTVNSDVLIPRYETEELVAFVTSDYQRQSTGKLLDIGTGSGAISLVLSQELSSSWEISASDISQEALAIAKTNFKSHGCEIKTIKSDLFKAIEGRFDVIVSNPPYIKTTETAVMDETVLNNEPNIALFAGVDGLDFYREFAKYVDDYLNPTGAFYLEFGYEQKEALRALFGHYLPNYDITFKNDLAGHPRMMRGVKQ